MVIFGVALPIIHLCILLIHSSQAPRLDGFKGKKWTSTLHAYHSMDKGIPFLKLDKKESTSWLSDWRLNDPMYSGPAQGHFEGTMKHRTYMWKRKRQLYNELLAHLFMTTSRGWLAVGGKHFLTIKSKDQSLKLGVSENNPSVWSDSLFREKE